MQKSDYTRDVSERTQGSGLLPAIVVFILLILFMAASVYILVASY